MKRILRDFNVDQELSLDIVKYLPPSKLTMLALIAPKRVSIAKNKAEAEAEVISYLDLPGDWAPSKE